MLGKTLLRPLPSNLYAKRRMFPRILPGRAKQRLLVLTAVWSGFRSHAKRIPKPRKCGKWPNVCVIMHSWIIRSVGLHGSGRLSCRSRPGFEPLSNAEERPWKPGDGGTGSRGFDHAWLAAGFLWIIGA